MSEKTNTYTQTSTRGSYPAAYRICTECKYCKYVGYVLCNGKQVTCYWYGDGRYSEFEGYQHPFDLILSPTENNNENNS